MVSAYNTTENIAGLRYSTIKNKKYEGTNKYHGRDSAVLSVGFRSQVNKVNPSIINSHPCSF